MKRKIYIQIHNHEKLVAHGQLYPEGNIQINWRADRGWVQEQYASLANIYGILPNVRAIYFYPPECQESDLSRILTNASNYRRNLTGE